MLKDRLKTGQMPWPVTFVMFWQQVRRGFAGIAEAPAWGAEWAGALAGP